MIFCTMSPCLVLKMAASPSAMERAAGRGKQAFLAPWGLPSSPEMLHAQHLRGWTGGHPYGDVPPLSCSDMRKHPE